MEAISYKLDVFEGPLDLLLHLISKHKIDINDIPILLLVEQYLDYVRQMKEEDMEVASEFLEMAARLIYIKTVSLLPVHEEEADELKKELDKVLADKEIGIILLTEKFGSYSRSQSSSAWEKVFERRLRPYLRMFPEVKG